MKGKAGAAYLAEAYLFKFGLPYFTSLHNVDNPIFQLKDACSL